MYKALIMPYFDRLAVCGDILGKDYQKTSSNSKLELLESWLPQIIKSDLSILDELSGEVLEDKRMRQLAIYRYKITHGISIPYLKKYICKCLWRPLSLQLKRLVNQLIYS